MSPVPVPAVPVLVLLAVFVLIAVRQVGRFRFRIWQAMCIGAAAVLVLGQIDPFRALRAINPDVMLFLFGMFVVGEALERSGYLNSLAFRLFSRARDGREFILLVLLAMGAFSAILMNDTIAIIGTPVAISYACRFGIDPKRALLALCIAVTTGSVCSPIGNPQNLLIATYGGLSQPFSTFFFFLALPTLVNLAVAYLFLTRGMRKGEYRCAFDGSEGRVKDRDLARLARLSLLLVLALIAIRIATGPGLVPLSAIALAGAAPVLLLSRDRLAVARSIDWPTLAFFAAMFVLMQSVYDTGFFQSGIDFGAVTSVPLLLGTSVVISQFISNVPFIALFLPLMGGDGMPVPSLMALAAGSTIAGNLTVLGAASNVIVIENAERRGYTLTFWEFLKVGAPLTAVQVLVYWVFLSWF